MNTVLLSQKGSMAHSARAIANEFLKLRASSTWPPQMLIQKLTYIAHGWNLAINGAPLVAEKAEAWDNGPVYRSIWDHIKHFGLNPENCTLIDPVNKSEIREVLTPDEKAIIDHVWAKYGGLNAHTLSQMTHEPNTPWFKAYFGRGKNSSLKDDDIREHYVQLAMAGREQATH